MPPENEDQNEFSVRPKEEERPSLVMPLPAPGTVVFSLSQAASLMEKFEADVKKFEALNAQAEFNINSHKAALESTLDEITDPRAKQIVANEIRAKLAEHRRNVLNNPERDNLIRAIAGTAERLDAAYGPMTDVFAIATRRALLPENTARIQAVMSFLPTLKGQSQALRNLAMQAYSKDAHNNYDEGLAIGLMMFVNSIHPVRQRPFDPRQLLENFEPYKIRAEQFRALAMRADKLAAEVELKRASVEGREPKPRVKHKVGLYQRQQAKQQAA